MSRSQLTCSRCERGGSVCSDSEGQRAAGRCREGAHRHGNGLRRFAAVAVVTVGVKTRQPNSFSGRCCNTSFGH
eukprot:scaffold2708_cov21-Phaeocystis_antarctica.AAC.1